MTYINTTEYEYDDEGRVTKIIEVREEIDVTLNDNKEKNDE